VTDGTSAAGARAVVSPALNDNAKSIYFGH
jgi:hypothetical protein